LEVFVYQPTIDQFRASDPLASSRERGVGSGFGVVNFAADNRTIALTIWRYQEGSFKEVTEPSKSTADISG
jgi:hypothetical protein